MYGKRSAAAVESESLGQLQAMQSLHQRVCETDSVLEYLVLVVCISSVQAILFHALVECVDISTRPVASAAREQLHILFEGQYRIDKVKLAMFLIDDLPSARLVCGETTVPGSVCRSEAHLHPRVPYARLLLIKTRTCIGKMSVSHGAHEMRRLSAPL